jgi:hypothetical protein
VFVSERQCGYCGEWLPETAFNRLRDGLQYWCRECFRAYFRARGDKHRRQAMEAKRKRMQVLRDYLDEYLAVHPCADCGLTDPRILEFDHLEDKMEDIGILWRRGRALSELKLEVAKCEVVCVNCHRRRTARRENWWRRELERALTPPKLRQKRNVLWVYRRLSESSCVDCGESDLVVLEFDHIGPKRAPVLSLAWGGYSGAVILAEMAQCEVRCSNCHQLRTIERRQQAA